MGFISVLAAQATVHMPAIALIGTTFAVQHQNFRIPLACFFIASCCNRVNFIVYFLYFIGKLGCQCIFHLAKHGIDITITFAFL